MPRFPSSINLMDYSSDKYTQNNSMRDLDVPIENNDLLTSCVFDENRSLFRIPEIDFIYLETNFGPKVIGKLSDDMIVPLTHQDMSFAHTIGLHIDTSDHQNYGTNQATRLSIFLSELEVAPFDERNGLFRELENNFIVYAQSPDVTVVTGKFSDKMVLPLTKQDRVVASNIGLFFENTPLPDGIIETGSEAMEDSTLQIQVNSAVVDGNFTEFVSLFLLHNILPTHEALDRMIKLCKADVDANINEGRLRIIEWCLEKKIISARTLLRY
jgi:hypothetical protein